MKSPILQDTAAAEAVDRIDYDFKRMHRTVQPYLTERQVWELLQRLTDRFRTGELLFDTLSPAGRWLSRIFTGGIVKWGIRDTRELEQ